MSGADDGVASGPRAGIDGAHPSGDTNAPTQLVPVVNPSPTVVDMGTVRAVARRAPAALPALGGLDGGPRVPNSARTTVDRRRKEQGKAPLSDDEPTPPPPPEPVLIGQPSPGRHEAPPDPAQAEAPVAAPIPAPAEPTAQALAAPAPPESPASPDSPVVLESPTSPGSPPLPESPAGPAWQQETTDPGLPIVPSGGEDGWLEFAPGGQPDPIRPGPAVLAEDSWDGPTGPKPIQEAYQGRRRAIGPVARRWYVLALVAVGLAAAVGAPFVLNSKSTSDTHAGEPAQFPIVVAVPTTSAEAGELSSPLSSPGAAVTGRPTATATGSPPPPTSGPPPTTTPPPSFGPLTYQAESAARSGSAQVDAAPQCAPSGPSVVSRIGLWTAGTTAGVVTFTVSVPSNGTYTMIVTYVLTQDTSRTALITTTNGGGTSSQTVTFLNTERPESPPGCVDPQPAISLSLRQGTNTISFANSANKAPTLDKIVISKP
jgi:hypothetical protein